MSTALQCLPSRFHCHRWSIRSHWYVPTHDVHVFAETGCADRYLAVSLRMQTQEQNKSEFPKVTPERYVAPDAHKATGK